MATRSQGAGAGTLTLTIEWAPCKDSKTPISPCRAKDPAISPKACSDPPCRVRDGLFLGSSDTEACCPALAAAAITHVLQVGSELSPSHRSLTYFHMSMSDEESEDLVGMLGPAFEFISAARQSGAVLVHCAQGMSRSAAVLAAYLMWSEALSCDEALAALRAARPVVDPNQGFLLQLQEFERRACCLDDWGGWGKEELRRSFRRSSTSGRHVVHTFSDFLRRFHCHTLDDDTVFTDDSILEA